MPTQRFWETIDPLIIELLTVKKQETQQEIDLIVRNQKIWTACRTKDLDRRIRVF